jgi:hypothetical protein
VKYPDGASASAGLEALRRGQVSGLVTALAREDLLGAAFGAVDEATAGELVMAALKWPGCKSSQIQNNRPKVKKR